LALPSLAAAAPAPWHEVATISTPTGDIGALSCTSATSCVADDASGHVVALDPSGAVPAVLRDVDGTTPLTGLSCPATGDCVMLDSQGNALVETAGVWSTASPIDAGHFIGAALSCPTTDFCLAAGYDPSTNDEAFAVYNGTSWSVTSTTESDVLNAVSCPSTAWCMVASLGGDAFTYSIPTQGAAVVSPMVAVNPGGPQTLLTSLDCPQAGLCLAASAEGQVFVYNTGAWSAPASLFSQNPASVSVACANAVCVAMNLNGEAIASTAPYVKWSYLVQDQNVGATEALSCFDQPTAPTGMACLGADLEGFTYGVTPVAVSYTPTFGANSVIVDPSGDLSTLACFKASHCLVGDRAGGVTTVVGSKATGRAVITARALGVTELACATSGTTCRALTGAGTLLRSTPSGGWVPVLGGVSQVACGAGCVSLSSAGVSAGAIVGPLPGFTVAGHDVLAALSCAPGTTSCVALDTNGDAWESWSGGWHHVAALRESSVHDVVTSLACVTANYCVAVDDEGNYFTYFGPSAGWTGGHLVTSAGLAQIACGSATHCVAVGNDGSAWTFSGRAWARTWSGYQNGTFTQAVTCASATTCELLIGHSLFSSSAAAQTSVTTDSL
jgi:hypothetical protein